MARRVRASLYSGEPVTGGSALTSLERVLGMDTRIEHVSAWRNSQATIPLSTCVSVGYWSIFDFPSREEMEPVESLRESRVHSTDGTAVNAKPSLRAAPARRSSSVMISSEAGRRSAATKAAAS